ncbi:MAG: DUF5989 family protein, partial [Alphaproteobacteria bacterium]
ARHGRARVGRIAALKMLGAIGRFLAVRKRLWLPPVVIVFALLAAVVLVNGDGGGLAFLYADF